MRAEYLSTFLPLVRRSSGDAYLSASVLPKSALQLAIKYLSSFPGSFQMSIQPSKVGVTLRLFPMPAYAICPYLEWPQALQLQLDRAQWGRWDWAWWAVLSNACIVPKLKVWSRFNSRTPNAELTVLALAIQAKGINCRQQSPFHLRSHQD